MKKRFLDRVHDIMNRGKVFVVGAAVIATVASVNAAEIVSYDQATGATGWDFSTILLGLVGVASLGIAAGATIFGIRRGWTLARSFFR